MFNGDVVDLSVCACVCVLSSHTGIATLPEDKEANPVATACSECGTSKKTGELSCCVRGGDWFKNCGNPGDTKFDHTWAEGIEACKGKLVTD